MPASFAVVSQGRWRFEKLDGSAKYTAEVIKLAAIPGIEDAPDKLTQLWNQTIVRDWPNAPTRVLPLRRFVNNGALGRTSPPPRSRLPTTSIRRW